MNLIDIFPRSGQIITFDILTIIFLVVIVINLIIGIAKGFFKELISFFGFFLVLIGAYLLCKPVGNLLYGVFGGAISNPIYDFLAGKNAGFAEVMTRSAAESQLPDLLNSIKIPSFFHSIFIKYIVGCIPEVDAEVSLAVGKYTANSIGLLACTAIAFLAVAIVLLVILYIIKRLTRKINGVPIIGWLNRLLGGVLGLLAGLIIVAGIGSLLSMLTGISFINTTLIDVLKVPLGDDTRWSFAKLFIENDIVNMVLGLILK